MKDISFMEVKYYFQYGGKEAEGNRVKWLPTVTLVRNNISSNLESKKS